MENIITVVDNPSHAHDSHHHENHRFPCLLLHNRLNSPRPTNAYPTMKSFPSTAAGNCQLFRPRKQTPRLRDLQTSLNARTVGLEWLGIKKFSLMAQVAIQEAPPDDCWFHCSPNPAQQRRETHPLDDVQLHEHLPESYAFSTNMKGSSCFKMF